MTASVGAFQAVEGAFSRHGSEQRIVAQAVVIVTIFLVQGEVEDPLCEQFGDRVLDAAWVAPVAKAEGESIETL